VGYVPERHIAKSDPYILMVWYLCFNVKSLTICEQSIQIQVRRYIHVCRHGSTQQLSADSCDRREGKGVAKF